MFLSNFSVKRPVAMVVIIIALMGLGLLALSKLRVNQIPDVEQPVLVVNISYPGASPDTVEREIVSRIEKSMQSISGIDRVAATASEGNARFVLFFNFNKNMIEAADEVRNAIGTVRHKLPTEIREPVLTRVDPSAQPILQLALSSATQSHAVLSRLAEDDLAERFRGIPGVATVNVNGALRRELSVLLRAEKLREFEISVTEVVAALRAQNTTAPVGKVRGALEDQSIRLVGRIESPAQFEQMVVRRRGEQIVRLGQVATVQDGFAELTGHSMRNGNPNVGLSVTRSRDASTVTVAEQARKLAIEIRKTLPAGTTLEVTQDGGKEAQNSLDNVVSALVIGAGLTVFVVYLFLALDADHGAVAADLGDRGLHRGLAVRFHAQLHEPVGPLAGHRRADRRRDRCAREHRAPHGARRRPRDCISQGDGRDRTGRVGHHLRHRLGVRAGGVHSRRHR